MFLPAVHAETDTAVLLQFIRENPLGILITGIQSSQQAFLQCSQVPFNPQVKAMIEAVDSKPRNVLEFDDDVMVLFNGKHDHYVTPKFYVETKPDTGKVVPTWNYSAVQIYGKLSIYYDSKTPETDAFLAKQLHDLSEHTERSIMGYTGGDKPQPWKVNDAPDSYIEVMKRNIVGIEIRVNKIEGKFKMSQEKPPGDRDGVVKGFARLGNKTGEAISALVKARGELHDFKKQALNKEGQ
ncbi:putative FMN-binding domain-containing protein [Lipomyces tetrasporus]|uniref:FMN-binding domain-containing protein n=1 Tax=Lipomyces tetrasporus TaxID=54092 RepID=A0AAD7QL09_9ASCO|nr:putative FMN-binding domain-containing protein [Lipomyces tetrasporus]KAJ8097198.1 putative FMN-binding domain-containing protein [Lipomyces tetrasporus]